MIENWVLFFCDGMNCKLRQEVQLVDGNIRHIQPDGWVAIAEGENEPRNYCRSCWSKLNNKEIIQ